jgi:hypothetical protein
MRDEVARLHVPPGVAQLSLKPLPDVVAAAGFALHKIHSTESRRIERQCVGECVRLFFVKSRTVPLAG